MNVHDLAGKPAPETMLVDVTALIKAYYALHPDVGNPLHRVSFGTSGHRGSSLKGGFNEDHILAVTQAICDYRKARNISGPLYLGRDTHALSEPSLATALEVLAANSVEVRIQSGQGYTPTPVISHAILVYNRGRTSGRADGIVVTPSHNPPEDGGFKYNPPHGGPADVDITSWIEEQANEYLAKGNRGVRRMPYERARVADTVHAYDYVQPYVEDLQNVIDTAGIAASGIRSGVDPLGGSALAFWGPIAERYGLNIEIVNQVIDPTFGFMTLDRDGKIRMDCSSPYAMARLIDLKGRYDIAFGNDPDADRHGIVAPGAGLMNPNHYLAVAVRYLFRNRPEWNERAMVGKTLVSSSLIDRVAGSVGRQVLEVPVGFKWFVSGLSDGSCGVAGEESAGATFLRRNGTVWTTDKDGIIMNLLAAEITARTGRDPGELYRALTEELGRPFYERIDVPATREQQAVLKNLSPADVPGDLLAGERIIAKLSTAPGNGSPIGGLKVVTENGWFAARPSGTEDVYKIYAESFRNQAHLKQIQDEAAAMVAQAFRRAGF